MANPLEQALQSGLKAGDEIGASFARMGTSEHPRGFVLSAYRNANRALTQALKEQNPLQAAREVTADLRRNLAASLRAELVDMLAFGKGEAARQLRFYGVQAANMETSIELFQQLEAVVLSLTSRLNAQEATLAALIQTGAQDEEILGNAERVGVLRPSDILIGATYWAAAILWLGFGYVLGRQPGAQQYKKQTIAALDERTTDCCLKVHGQIQPLNRPFILTGTPRFADKMDWPGFHAYCRTSAVLYDASYDLGLTDQMRAAADRLMREREAGGSGYRHPAHARS